MSIEVLLKKLAIIVVSNTSNLSGLAIANLFLFPEEFGVILPHHQ
ncbi:hypothetical protein [Planktothrix sp. FACHB-1365]|nr:hypothetical protein [Planktothrix sp. FACHB-1365]